MRAFASSFYAWKSLERQEGVKVPHGLVFPLAVVEAIGAPHGLRLVAEEHTDEEPTAFDMIMISVLDSRCLMSAGSHFARWRVPLRRRDRGDRYPIVFAGGQGLSNPLPMAEIADIVVLGDAEPTLPKLLDGWGRGRKGFLAFASTIPGVYVPAHHDRREVTLSQAIADDISITLRENISVSLDGSRRLEIARGCKYKCAFCSLGWRTPVRENTAADVIASIVKSPKRVHLQAGDAESHSGISEIRSALRAHGGSDLGWTGRLDSLFENPDQTIPGQKRYAFGVEGVSHRLRAGVGKGYLTDDRLVDDTLRFFRSIEGEGKGRAAWHMMCGLPTEKLSESVDLLRVLRRVDEGMRGGVSRNLALHWQPFQPLPMTPMQWCGAGSGARKWTSIMSSAEKMTWLRVRQLGGRTNDAALLCTVLSRSDERGADLLERIATDRVGSEAAAQIAGVGHGPLDPDASLPWDFVRTWMPREKLRTAYDVMMRRLGDKEKAPRQP